MVLWEVIFLVTVFLMLGKQRVWNVTASKNFSLENAGYLIMGLMICIAVYFLNRKFGRRIEDFLRRRNRILLGVTLLLLFVWEMYACYGGYFESGWDAQTIHDTVFYEVTNAYQNIDSEYFSWYPNNKLIVWIFTGIVRTSLYLGFSNWEYALVVFQIVLAVVTMFLVYRVTFSLTKSYRFSWAVYAAACLFVGLSPWHIVVYSDSTALILPLLMVRIYQQAGSTENRKKKAVLWILQGFLGVAGFYLKPQTMIVLIALVIVEILTALHKVSRPKIRGLAARFSLIAGGVLVFCLLYTAGVAPSLHMEINPDTTISFRHYIMMGLNSRTDGIYSDRDRLFTESFSTNEERNEADMRVVRGRLKIYGPGGLLYHLGRKQLVNYGDGTFAWDVEGHSFNGDPAWAENAASGLVRSLIKPNGENYDVFLSYMQMIWMTLVFFLCFTIFYGRDISEGTHSDRVILVMLLSVIGLTLFELLFEARARYLFCYSPVYVILGMTGIRNVFHAADRYIRFRDDGIR
ncbi:glycosyltransferase family protein [Clostridium vitabionis]|uniref:hypothetical protein n=1 Tax=Clostridium vitabionis TaxID=2784388 RepID=UPI00188ACC94|nr:hypothetical protein [Clostridium vitabionis]